MMKKVFTAIGWTLLYFLLYFVLQNICSLGLALMYDPGFMSSATPGEMASRLTDAIIATLAYAVAMSGVIMVGILFILKPRDITARKLYQIKSPGVMTLLSSMGFGIGFYMLVSIMMAIIPWPQEWMQVHNNSTETLVGGNALGTLICLSIFGPIAEEFLLRGAVYGVLKRAMPRPVAIIIQASIFGLMHGNIVQFSYTFLMGIFAALLLEWTRSIWPAVILHMMLNGTSLGLNAIQKVVLSSGEGENPQYALILLAAMLGMVLLGALGGAGIVHFTGKRRASELDKAAPALSAAEAAY